MEVHDVVISGMSGRFPNSENVEELAEFLKNKVNLVSDEGRWEAGELGVPHQIGKISDPYVFDLTYFGIHRKLAEYMDPNVKLVLENSVAAVHDAGLSLDDVYGQEIATIVGSSVVETEYEVLINNHRMDQNILSHSVCMQANRLAYYLDLKGPSYVCDSGWNGAMSGLRHARNLIARGGIKAALVSASSVLFLPQASYHYHRLGRLSNDGKTKCFSNDAAGYCRAEACVVFFLQRKEDALRNYGTILGVDLTQNGSKEGSITDCSSLDSRVLKRIYEEKCIDPSSVAYLEASGCASKKVDAKELNLVSEVFLKNRTEPLPIGSVKSNLGHSEAASGFVGIVKAIISAEHNLIPPNLHYSDPNELVPALVSGQLQVVTEPTPLKGDLLAVNNISAHGGFAHVVIKKNTKSKKRKCEVGVLPPDGLPRIVLLSARELNALNEMLDKVEKMPIDEEFIALSYRAFGRGVKRHMFRGYTLLHDSETGQKFRQVKEYPGGEPRPLWFVFAGMGSQWPGMATDLMQLPTFAKAIHFCHKLLEPFGLDLLNIVTNPHPDLFKNILNCFVGIAAVQVGLVDVLREVGLEADGFVGHSLGELGCAYVDGTFTAEQMIMGAYFRGKVSADSGISDGLMAAVGKGYKFLKDKVPEGIDIACRNSSTSCTISGPANLIEEYMEVLSSEKIFVRSVPSGDIAYHSRYIQQLGPAFLECLKKLVPHPKPRSTKWISSSVPEANWNSLEAIFSSAEYHTNNLLSPVLFEEAISHVPKDAIILEVAPRGLLQAILKRALPSATYISLTSKDENGHLHVMSAFGKLYNEGISVNVEKLYPPVEFPVSRGTPHLANFITWIHNESWRDYAFLEKKREVYTVKDIYFNDSEESNIFSDHKIHNNTFIPDSVYIDAVIHIIHKISREPVKAISLTNLAFKKIIKYGEEKPIRVALQEGSGHWEVSVEKDLVGSGRIEVLPFVKMCDKVKPAHVPSDFLNSEEIYLYLEEMGLSLNEEFKTIMNLNINEDGSCSVAEILWNSNWLKFLDSLFVFLTFTYSYYKNKLYLVESINEIFLDLNLLSSVENNVVKVYYNKAIGLLWADGLEIHFPVMKETNLQVSNDKRKEFLVPRFVTFDRTEGKPQDFLNFHELCTKIILNNIPQRKLHVFSLCENVGRQKELFNMLNYKFDSKEVLVTLLPDDSALLYALNISLKNSCTLIINEGTTLENTLKILKNVQAGFLLCRNIESSTSLEYVLSQTFGNDTYFLYKTVTNYPSLPISIMMSHSNWKNDLHSKLSEEKDRIVYVVGHYSSLNFAHEVVQHCSAFSNSHLLRFVFMESQYDEFRPDLFKEQLNKDLRINIYKNKKWGTYIFCSVEFPFSSKNSLRTLNSVYQFRNIIKVSGVNIMSLGLNMSGMVEEKKKLGVFEYSGIQNRKPICGLASLNERTTTLELDPVYLWTKPEHWTHEDIAAVLVPYAIAYHILVVECSNNPIPIKRVLVLNGELPLSQAIIRLSILQGYEVFTTYDDIYSQKDAIKGLFPEINESNILKGDSRLNSTIRLLTKGEEMQVVVNTSSRKDMLLPAMNSLGTFSKFFQVSAKETKPGVTIGMRAFLKNVCCYGIGPEVLLKLTKQEKQTIAELVDQGLKNGGIKPIKKYTLPSSSFNMEAISLIKDDYVLNKKYVVVTKENGIQSELTESVYRCSAEKMYILLGNEHIFWFDLIHWLISRGGRQFIIMVDNISSLLAKRLSFLINQNENIQIYLYSTKKVQTAEQARNFINQTEENFKIGGIFVFGKNYYNEVNEISKHLSDARIVFIGEEIEMNEKCGSFKPLAIKITHDQKDLRTILQNLDSLLSKSEPVVYLKEFSVNTNEMDSSHLTHWQHLPGSTSSIAYLAKTAGKVDWKEVRTSAPPQCHSRELAPVFVLPPLRKGQLDQLIQALFHPAFIAVLPPFIHSLEELAKQLYQGLMRFDCNVFTIICADWSYTLGLALGKCLEHNGKAVSLIMLDTNISWANQGVLKSIYDKARKALLMDNKSTKEVSLFEKGFDILENHIERVCNSFLPDDLKLAGFCHVLQRKNSQKNLSQITERCERPVKVHTLPYEDFLEMMNSSDIAKIINSVTLVEHKDSAYPVTRDYENVKLIISDQYK